jgi:hypothetical protein
MLEVKKMTSRDLRGLVLPTPFYYPHFGSYKTPEPTTNGFCAFGITFLSYCRTLMEVAATIVVPSVEIVEADAFGDEYDPNYLSLSPRERLESVDDRKEVQAIEAFDDNGQLRMLQRLLMVFRLEAIKRRPEDIIAFGCEFFAPQNRRALQAMMVDGSTDATHATTQSGATPAGTGSQGHMGQMMSMSRPSMRSGNQQMQSSDDWSPQGK